MEHAVQGTQDTQVKQVTISCEFVREGTQGTSASGVGFRVQSPVNGEKPHAKPHVFGVESCNGLGFRFHMYLVQVPCTCTCISRFALRVSGLVTWV